MGEKRTKKTVSKKNNELTLNDKLMNVFENNKGIIRFAGLYLLYIAILTLLYITVKDDLQFMRDWTANGLAVILNLLGVENSQMGSYVYLENISLRVIDECTGIYEILVYSSCVLAYSTTYAKKTIGIVFGIPAILGINMIRLVSLSFVGIWSPEMFDYVHYYLWQITLLIIIAIVVIVWIEKVVKK